MSDGMVSPVPIAPPLTIGACATLACLWEATAPKPGNVYRGADFEDLTYADFLTSAALIGPVVENVRSRGVGATVHAGVAATRLAAGSNVNLGMLLLLVPLAAVPPDEPLERVAAVLHSLSHVDTREVYAAIRLAQPGGLGKVDQADVNAVEAPNLSLREAMSLAAERDLVARQYVNDFADVFWAADRIAEHVQSLPLSDAIVRAYLKFLAQHPDSLVARKCGPAVAKEVSQGAAAVLDSLRQGHEAYTARLADFDFFLRADGHRRNPGTTADLMAAALFVLLRDGRLNWPVRFY
jgi:triphosphoribosyl-dephospho-CoA synthase